MSSHPTSRQHWSFWDTCLVGRAAGFGALSLAVLFAITMATDEGGIPAVVRMSRVLPASPIAAAIGTWMALRSARARGELTTLATLGRSPGQSIRGAVLGGGAVLGVVAGFILTLDAAGIASFYPANVNTTETYTADGSDYVEVHSGARWSRGGVYTTGPPNRPPVPVVPPPDHAHAMAAMATILAGIGLSHLVARTQGARTLALLLALSPVLIAELVVFHAAAVHKLPSWTVLLPPLALLLLSTVSAKSDPSPD